MTAPAVHEIKPSELASPKQPQSDARWLMALLIVWSLAITGFTIGLKCHALANWRYTSDMFVVDTMLQETLRGHFIVEYTYGRQFGDHALLILLPLIPIKWLAGKHMVWLLILISPLMLLISGWIMIWIVRAVAGASWALLAGFLWFFSVGVIQGPFEETFGLHIDTIGGFAASVMVALLWLYDERGPNRRVFAGALTATCFFCLIKEEMALLAIIFYVLLLTRNRERLHWTGLLVSSGIFAMELIIIRICRSPWSRTNELLVRQVKEIFQEQGLSYLFNSRRWSYWLTVSTVVATMSALLVLTRRVNIFAACLFAVGLLKLSFAWFAQDFDRFSWHNYSALMMLIGAIILQAMELRHIEPRMARIAITTLVILSLGAFILGEIPGARWQIARTEVIKKRMERNGDALANIQQYIDKSKVVSIPLNTDIAWLDGWRYTFYPNGITTRLTGYVEYLVIPRDNKPQHPLLRKAPFVQIRQNRFYRLYQRKKYLPGELESRSAFIKYYGADSVGAEPTPKKKKKKPASTSATRGS
jgi:hypothetical protein